MSTTSLENNLSVCANCGKGEEESANLKSCAACKLVKYCVRDCQATHRPQHKKACKKRAAEIYDEKLFKRKHLSMSALSVFYPFHMKIIRPVLNRAAEKLYVMVVFMQ